MNVCFSDKINLPDYHFVKWYQQAEIHRHYIMGTPLHPGIVTSHLREDKQIELKTITEIILFKITAEMVILFGSHTRGYWVEICR